MYDVVALGELLIDFVETGEHVFKANPGGAVCNVLAQLQKLGNRTAYIGKVGNDSFGRYLEDTLKELDIDTCCLRKDDKIPTTLAFVHKKEDGDRDFSFYRNPGADIMLNEEEIDYSLIENTRIFHFGSLSLTDEPCRSATIKALEFARAHNKLISYDPNLRKPLWPSLEEAKKWIAFGMNYADILKISDDEICWFTGKEDYDEALASLKKDYPNLEYIFLTLGKDGSRCIHKDEDVSVKGKTVVSIDNTGAGDSFCGAMLHCLLHDDFRKSMKEKLDFANSAAAIVTTKTGALKEMADLNEIGMIE